MQLQNTSQTSYSHPCTACLQSLLACCSLASSQIQRKQLTLWRQRNMQRTVLLGPRKTPPALPVDMRVLPLLYPPLPGQFLEHLILPSSQLHPHRQG